MKHSTTELIDVARLYYPRDIRLPNSDVDEAAYMESEERRRLMAARVEAATRRGPWRAMLARLGEQLPGWEVFDKVRSCPPGSFRASYEGSIGFPAYTGPKLTGLKDEDAEAILAAVPPYDHEVGFCVSFLAPYYIVYVVRVVDDPEREEAVRQRHEKRVLLGVGEPTVLWSLPRDVVKPEILEEADREFEKRKPATRRDVRFDISPGEQPYVTIVAREIEATYGYEPMPPDVGRMIVPDVRTDFRLSGEATLYDCLLTEHM